MIFASIALKYISPPRNADLATKFKNNVMGQPGYAY